MAATPPDARVVVEAPGIAVLASLRGGKLGVGDPCVAYGQRDFVRAMRTPDGAATVAVRESPEGAVVEAWGPGAGWALGFAREIVGADDTTHADFAPPDALVAKLLHRHPGLRVSRVPWVFDALTQVILLQRVNSRDGSDARRALVKRVGAPAPGPHGLLLPLSAAEWRETPRWLFTKLAVDVQRASTLLGAARHEKKLAALATATHAEARRLLGLLDGVGPWTIESMMAHVFGDPDALVTGDYWLPHLVSNALAGEPRATDARMAELLEPYRPHRARVIQLLYAGGFDAPRFAPKRPSPLFRRRR